MEGGEKGHSIAIFVGGCGGGCSRPASARLYVDRGDSLLPSPSSGSSSPRGQELWSCNVKRRRANRRKRGSYIKVG